MFSNKMKGKRKEWYRALYPLRSRLTILILLHMHIGIEQFSKEMADGWNQVSHCWNGDLQVNKGKSLQ